mgnify:CR=1 FL=1
MTLSVRCKMVISSSILCEIIPLVMIVGGVAFGNSIGMSKHFKYILFYLVFKKDERHILVVM